MTCPELEGTHPRTATRAADIRVCFVGDSITLGWGDPECRGWVGRVSAAASSRGFPVTAYNLGVRRHTSGDIRARWEEECGRRFTRDGDRVLVFSFGVNDAVFVAGAPRVTEAETLANAAAMFAHSYHYHRVLMVGPTPVRDPAHSERIGRLSQLIGPVAAQHGVDYLDVFGALCGNPTWQEELASGDGAHPGARGYEALAGVVERWPQWPFLEKRRAVQAR